MQSGSLTIFQFIQAEWLQVLGIEIELELVEPSYFRENFSVVQLHVLLKPWIKRFPIPAIKNPGFWKDVILEPH